MMGLNTSPEFFETTGAVMFYSALCPGVVLSRIHSIHDFLEV